MAFKTIIEPFRIKMVEPIYMSSPAERSRYLKIAFYNPFLLHSTEVLIDLLTDSGTGAMSAAQWSGMMIGDESYAGAQSWERFQSAIRELTSMPFILPTHQGRAAERILYGHLGKKGKTFISNTHFDTTRANIEFSGAEAIDIPCLESKQAHSEFPFKGNIDTEQLQQRIREKGAKNIAAVILTVTNNSGGGQAVSMENAKATAEICKREGLLFVLDMCRIAENAWYIKQFEKSQSSKSYEEIAREMCALADACIMSAKKDALVNMGGFLSLRDKSLADACTNLLIITEGFATYGGLSGRDMEAVAIGIKEVFQADYLEYRIRSTQYLGDHLIKLGVPVVHPIGGHAVYIDAKEFLPHIPVDQYPGQALVCALYLIGGIRCVEVGSVMFGKYDEKGKLIPAPRELVRLAIPRRVYTQSHIDYVIEVFEKIKEEGRNLKGLRIIEEPAFLRHFTARFEQLQ